MHAKPKIHAPYPDSAQGLKQQLKDMREMARGHMSDKLRAMVTDLEIPDARAWYLANFGASGLETAELLRANLSRHPRSGSRMQMTQFSREDGYFSVKKQDAEKGMIQAWLQPPRYF